MSKKRFMPTSNQQRRNQKSDHFRIIDEAGEEVFSFTLDDEHVSITIYYERAQPGFAVEAPTQRLARQAKVYYEVLMHTLDAIEAIDPSAYLSLCADMFGDDE